jgi:hypothetical protein
MKYRLFFYATTILCGILLLSGCTQPTTPTAQPADSRPVDAFTPEAAPTAAAEPSATLTVPPSVDPLPVALSTPTLAPVPVDVVEGNGLNHELVFAIRNAGRYSGEGGQPAWLGWGADNFAVAPDGSFWIADTPADPDRLLHYSSQGELLQAIPLLISDRRYWSRDLAADASGVWVLDYISQPGLVLHFNQEGGLLARYEIPEQFATYTQEDNVMPGLWHIPFTEAGKVILDGPVGIVEMTLSGDGVSFQELQSYPLGGHVYTEEENGLMVDDLRVGVEPLQPDHFLNYAWLLGAASDGSFYVRVDEGNNDQGKAEPPDRYVRRYSSTGDLLGIALLPWPELDQAYDVALGPDGNVYAMYSRTDHSVDILRLRFYTGAAPLLSTITSVPQPSFQPLLPSGETPATDEDAAREAMLSFFTALAERRFEDAVSWFGGSYDEYKLMDDSISSDQPAMAWQNICQMEFCLEVSDILDARQATPEKYEFLLGFVTANGSRFDYSICCGYFAPIPSETWFVYSVTVERVNGQWLVMSGPHPQP